MVCESTKQHDLKHGRRMQTLMIYNGLSSVAIIADRFIHLFASHGLYIEANEAFTSILQPTLYTLNAIINAHVKLGEGELVLSLFQNMQHSALKPDKFTFPSALKACGFLGSVEQGRYIHEHIISNEIQIDVVVGSTLVDMYVKCRSLEEAMTTFDGLPQKNVVSWTSIISGYAQHSISASSRAVVLFEKMLQHGVKPDKVIFLSIIKACNSLKFLEQGRFVHELLITCGLHSELMISSALVDMYAKCASCDEAHVAFFRSPTEDATLWSTMIAAYAQHGDNQRALECFEQMQRRGIKPNKLTFLRILKACGSIGSIMEGRRIHERIIKNGLQNDAAIASTLVDMYAKSASLEEAQMVFDRLQDQDVVSWGVMIAGYAYLEKGAHAIACFEGMQYEGVKPDKVTFLSILKACGAVGAIQNGRYIHHQIIENALQCDIVIGNTLVDMYAKCGNLEEAHELFCKLQNQDVVSWDAMITGYALRGEAGLAVQCFEDMKIFGISPHDIAFSGILIAFSRSGFLEEAIMYFSNATTIHSIKPTLNHVSCIVDLLGRCGHLYEAEALLKCVAQRDACLWTILLSSCSTYCNIEIGSRCFESIVHVDPCYGPAYVLMSNIYAVAYQVESVQQCASIK